VIRLRSEQRADADSIRTVIRAAFATHPLSLHNEERIVDTLRDAGVLTVSIVALSNDDLVGHIACSPVAIDGLHCGWYGLGPVAVRPDVQRRGIGAMLVRASIAELEQSRADGIVLLGDFEYYERFGFARQTRLVLPGAPANHFLSLSLQGGNPSGTVTYHAAFSG